MNTIYGLLGAQTSPLFHRPLAQSVTAYARQSIHLTRRIVQEELQGKLLSTDTDSVLFQVNQNTITAEQILDQVTYLNKRIAETLQTDLMVHAIEEIIVPASQGMSAVFNFSNKSYMFSYVS